VDAMALPNKRDQFPKLFSVVHKPAPKVVNNDSDRPRRRRVHV
jgi:hypothetical protein